MIDNVKITLNECDCDFSKCAFKGVKFQWNVYYLYSDIEDDEAFLQLEYLKSKNILRISGSIRKWYLGLFSLSDLNKNQFELATKKIAKYLRIPYNKFCEGTITNCEIGLNIKTRIPSNEVNELVTYFSKLDYYRYKYDTVGFLSEDLKIKLYNKCEELLKHYGKYDKGNFVQKHFEELAKKGIFYLRIEFTLKDNRSFSSYGLENLNSIGAIVSNYARLVEFWTNQCSKIQLMSGINFDDEKMTKEHYAVLVGVHSLGVVIFTERYAKKSENKKNAKGKKHGSSAITALSRARKEVSDIINMYRLPDTYNVGRFRVDIFKTLKSKMGDDNDISMRTLILSLWGNYQVDNNKGNITKISNTINTL